VPRAGTLERPTVWRGRFQSGSVRRAANSANDWIIPVM